VQAQTYLFPASVLALTRWRFGFHFLGEALWEWLTEFPKTGPLPQMSHVFGMVVLSISLLKGLFYTIIWPGFQIEAEPGVRRIISAGIRDASHRTEFQGRIIRRRIRDASLNP